jgi:hypothetical protein
MLIMTRRACALQLRTDQARTKKGEWIESDDAPNFEDAQPQSRVLAAHHALHELDRVQA